MSNRLFYGWYVTGAAALGIACSFSVLVVTITSIFQAPLAAEMHWSAEQIFLGPTVAGLCGLLTAPLIGALSDRLGAKRIILASFVLELFVLGSFRFMDSNILGYWIRYGALAILCMGTTQVAFSRIISSWFNRRLGLGLGIALAGVGVGGFGWSLLIQRLIDLYGWRDAYLGIAIIIGLVTIPILALVLRETPAQMGLHVDGAAQPTAADAVVDHTAGMSLGEAAHTGQYWLMVLAFFLLGLALQGAQLHIIPLLRSRGVTADQAAFTQAMMLITVVAGRVASGWLLDRFFAPRVAQAFILAPIIGICALTLGASGPLAMASAMCIGLAVGGESDVIAYLVRRYFGMKQYSRIYGTFFSAFGAGSAIGPAATAWGVTHVAGGYSQVLWAHVGVLVVTIALLAAFRSYQREA